MESGRKTTAYLHLCVHSHTVPVVTLWGCRRSTLSSIEWGALLISGVDGRPFCYSGVGDSSREAYIRC